MYKITHQRRISHHFWKQQVREFQASLTWLVLRSHLHYDYVFLLHLILHCLSFVTFFNFPGIVIFWLAEVSFFGGFVYRVFVCMGVCGCLIPPCIVEYLYVFIGWFVCVFLFAFGKG